MGDQNDREERQREIPSQEVQHREIPSHEIPISELPHQELSHPETRDSAYIALQFRIDELSRLHEFWDELAAQRRWPDRLKSELTLVVEELATNTIVHGFPENLEPMSDDRAAQPESPILRSVPSIRIAVTGLSGVTVEVTIEDDGVPFDPLGTPAPDLTLDVDDRPIGGLGVFFARQLTDDIRYERTASGGNRIVFRKTVPSS